MTHLLRLKNPTLLSPHEAEWLFSYLKDESGIPWQPADEGCWERAHMMCTLMQQAGALPSKRWAFSGAKIRTPKGQKVMEMGLRPDVAGLPPLGWSVHVAPMIWVDGLDGMQRKVFDPVVCSDRAIEVEQWQELLNLTSFMRIL